MSTIFCLYVQLCMYNKQYTWLMPRLLLIFITDINDQLGTQLQTIPFALLKLVQIFWSIAMKNQQ